LNTHNLQHGHCVERKRSPEYVAWINMKNRCGNPNREDYKLYGALGVKVCEEWKDDFAAFVEHVGLRPSAQHSLDRYPVMDGNYEPGNVRWATDQQQANNRRSNRVIEHAGEKLTMAEWARRASIKLSIVHARLKDGWDFSRAISTPVRVR